jgi:peroxin-19
VHAPPAGAAAAKDKEKAAPALPPLPLAPADMAALSQLMAELGVAADGEGEEGGGGGPTDPQTATAAADTLAALAGAAPTDAGQDACQDDDDDDDSAGARPGPGAATPSDFDPLLARLEATLASLGGAAAGGAAGGGGEAVEAGSDEEGEGGDPVTSPGLAGLADTVMRSLLARGVLHAPLAEVAAAYRAWLEAEGGAGRLEAGEEARYTAQLGCVRRIVALYDEEAAEEEAGAAAGGGRGGRGGGGQREKEQADRFPALFALLREMQSHGQPPQAIVDQLAPGLAFDGDGLPILPGGGGSGGAAAAALGGLLGGGGGTGGTGGAGACSVM